MLQCFKFFTALHLISLSCFPFLGSYFDSHYRPDTKHFVITSNVSSIFLKKGMNKKKQQIKSGSNRPRVVFIYISQSSQWCHLLHVRLMCLPHQFSRFNISSNLNGRVKFVKRNFQRNMKSIKTTLHTKHTHRYPAQMKIIHKKKNARDVRPGLTSHLLYRNSIVWPRLWFICNIRKILMFLSDKRFCGPRYLHFISSCPCFSHNTILLSFIFHFAMFNVLSYPETKCMHIV